MQRLQRGGPGSAAAASLRLCTQGTASLCAPQVGPCCLPVLEVCGILPSSGSAFNWSDLPAPSAGRIWLRCCS